MERSYRYDFSFGQSEKTDRLFQELGRAPGWCKVSGDDLEHPVLVRFALSHEGALTINGLVAGAFNEDAVGARSLRGIRIGEILGRLPDTAWRKLRSDDGDVTIGTFAELAGLLVRVRAAPTASPRPKPGPKGWPDEQFQLVAESYRRALREHPRNPISALAKEQHVSTATVRRWVQRARDKGYLGDSVQGKAGEIRSTRRRRSI